MPEPKDDFAAVRSIVETLTGFDAKDQERIIRWAREKVGLATVPAVLPAGSTQLPTLHPEPPVPNATAPTGSRDLKTFVAEKKPKNDVQFATTVAYYHRFEAPESLRKKEINGDDLQEGCRLVGRERFTNPSQTLRNAHTLGLLNKGSEAGFFAVNSVGENLVAVTLPGDGGNLPRTKKSKKKKKKKKLKRKKLTKTTSKK